MRLMLFLNSILNLSTGNVPPRAAEKRIAFEHRGAIGNANDDDVDLWRKRRLNSIVNQIVPLLTRLKTPLSKSITFVKFNAQMNFP